MDEELFWLESPDLNNFAHLDRMSFSSRYSASTWLRKYYFERTGYRRNTFFKTLRGDVIHNSIESLNKLLADEECANEEDIFIILQKRVLISKNETENTLKKKILLQEHKIYPQSIISIFK